ncbi:MAG: phytanoyl-CoA dioxygenase family protein [Chloroflexi bacterium]|nr:phytanoyl-CoA dioxygenase family protein [Chloroflexota bacterium]
MLTDADRDFFDQNGYLVVHQLIPRKQVEAVTDAIWDFLEFDRGQPSDWYREPHRPNGMVEMYHHQALWDVRQNPRIYELFRDLFGRDDLWVFIDRANLKPPPNESHPEYDHQGMVHWDIDVRETPTPFLVQGVLYLVDTREGEGGFQCVPGVHRRAAEISAGISDQDLRHQQLHERFPEQIGPPIEIEANAGDFIIWHSALPHGNSRNLSNKPRLAQYVRLFPAEPSNEELREQRIASWRKSTHPAFQNPRAFPGDPRAKEAMTPPAELTPLGRKLLGLDDWN